MPPASRKRRPEDEDEDEDDPIAALAADEGDIENPLMTAMRSLKSKQETANRAKRSKIVVSIQELARTLDAKFAEIEAMHAQELKTLQERCDARQRETVAQASAFIRLQNAHCRELAECLKRQNEQVAMMKAEMEKSAAQNPDQEPAAVEELKVLSARQSTASDQLEAKCVAALQTLSSSLVGLDAKLAKEKMQQHLELIARMKLL
eukprot:m.554309 g.554309  ORF g.554309 m.554309 type:complete len:206 (+) comp57748_c0_seq6:1781-2398(+)